MNLIWYNFIIFDILIIVFVDIFLIFLKFSSKDKVMGDLIN
jgi:hypothetical protein